LDWLARNRNPGSVTFRCSAQSGDFADSVTALQDALGPTSAREESSAVEMAWLLRTGTVRGPSLTVFARLLGSHLPMQNRCFSPRMNICPSLIAGEAKHFSPRAFWATRANSGPGFTTFITPSSLRK